MPTSDNGVQARLAALEREVRDLNEHGSRDMGAMIERVANNTAAIKELKGRIDANYKLLWGILILLLGICISVLVGIAVAGGS